MKHCATNCSLNVQYNVYKLMSVVYVILNMFFSYQQSYYTQNTHTHTHYHKNGKSIVNFKILQMNI